MTDDIAIVGMAGRFPGADDIVAYWDNILAGRVTTTTFDRVGLIAEGVSATQAGDPAYVPVRGIISDPDRFDAAFFGITPREAEIMDPQHRLLLETAWAAAESAALVTDAPPGRVGVFAGSGFNYYLINHVLPQPGLMDTQGLLSVVLGNEKDHLAAKVAYRLNLGGPAVTIQTACSTSLVAVHLACQSLRSGDSDAALAGGVCVAVPQRAGYLYEPRGILSPDGSCRPFDAGARGTVPGNGVAVVALKRAAEARRDGDTVYALIKGSAINNDGGAKVGYTAPGVAGQVDVLTRAYGNAGIDPATIGYLEAHGTATEVGDAIELAALAEVFGSDSDARACSLGSVKANVGHLDAAAGVAGLIKVALALHARKIPPLAGLREPRAGLVGGAGPFVVDRVTRDWDTGRGEARRGAVSSFGLGGTNAHVILEEEPDRAAAEPAMPPGAALLPVSARTPEALREAAARLAVNLREHPDRTLREAALTLQSYRRHFPCRLAVSARGHAEAAERLACADGTQAKRRPSVVFLFPGQGTEFAGMSANAYEHHPEFRADIDAGAQQLRDSLGLDVRAVLLGDDPDGVIHRTDVTQPALVLHEYALGRLLLSWGVAPSAMIGHSVGEFAAACLAGEMSLADTLRLVVARGRLAQDAPAGGMVAVLGTVSACHQYLAGLDELDIAVLNGPEATVVAGPVAPLAAFQRRLAEAGVPHRALPAQRAFHSRMMAAAAERLAAESVAVATRPRRHEIVSTIDGHLLGKRQTRPAGYWAEQLRRPVDFQCALQTASQLTEPVFVEVGPGDALCGMARQLMLPGAATVIALQASSRPARTDQALDALGALWAAGASPDWPAVRGRDTCGRAVLPAYPFARTRHWIGGSPALAPAAAGTPAAGDTPATGGPVLREVIDIWQNMLGAPGIGPESNFFELGGQSLLFIRMTARVQRVFDVALDVSELADAPTPLAVAEQIAGKVPR